MKVILRKSIESLGKLGDIVTVADGYALNYLIPRSYAFQASKGNILAFSEEKKQIEKLHLKEVNASKSIAEKLNDEKVQIMVQVGEEDKLFGSVTSQNIVDALAEKGYNLDKRKIQLDEPIKALGIFDVAIKLHQEFTAHVKVWVVREVN